MILLADCYEVATSEEFADYIVDYSGRDIQQNTERYADFCPVNAGEGIYILYDRLSFANNEQMLLLSQVSYKALPKLYGEMDVYVAGLVGAIRVQNTMGLMLDGQDVIVGIIDSGIDYANDVFRYSSGESRIIEMWDQSAIGDNTPEKYKYGNIYTQEDINLALENGTVLEGQSEKDTTGHGTIMASIAAGGRDYENDFTGIAPNADIAVVKLKSAKQYLRNFFLIKEDAVAYQENDIIAGIDYLENLAAQTRKPLVICLGVGTGSGARLGRSFLEKRIDDCGNKAGCCITTAAGNEGNAKHHFQTFLAENEVKTMEVRADRSFTLEIWARSPDIVSVSIISPSGETVPRIPARIGQSNVLNFLFENTVIYVDYKIVEQRTGEELIMLRFQNPTIGIWKIELYGNNIVNGNVNAWLPIKQFCGNGVFFLEPSPNETITPPADAQLSITMAGYNSENNSTYIESGRGFTQSGNIKPDMSAPAVSVLAATKDNRYVSVTGTSIASAICAGTAAQLMQWGIVRGNQIDMNSQDVKNYLIRGAVRGQGRVYPNRENGYGVLNIYNTFDIFR